MPLVDPQPARVSPGEAQARDINRLENLLAEARQERAAAVKALEAAQESIRALRNRVGVLSLANTLDAEQLVRTLAPVAAMGLVWQIDKRHGGGTIAHLVTTAALLTDPEGPSATEKDLDLAHAAFADRYGDPP